MEDPAFERPSFGQQIASLRAERHLTVSETAGRAGISRQTLYRIEKGHTGNPRRDVIMRVAAALGVDAFRLLKQDGASAREITFKMLWQHASEISEEDWRLVKEVEDRVTHAVQAARKN